MRAAGAAPADGAARRATLLRLRIGARELLNIKSQNLISNEDIRSRTQQHLHRHWFRFSVFSGLLNQVKPANAISRREQSFKGLAICINYPLVTPDSTRNPASQEHKASSPPLHSCFIIGECLCRWNWMYHWLLAAILRLQF
ncbi:hypothetical protein UY3_17851 [Chelonia mydas]|uniref:Uncharacterized protein n=1 Tax=Chelonia mydas TaxID=8469 RepID=M7AQS0_CHEMY|nr:hypothetical protein UY3_17851 [Chelonia mydas]